MRKTDWRCPLFQIFVLMPVSVALLGLLFLRPAFGQEDKTRLPWSLRLIGAGPRQVEVTVDTTQLRKNERVDGFVFVVDFYDGQHREVVRRTFDLLQTKWSSLEPGFVYRRLYDPPQRGVVFVSSPGFDAVVSTLGAKADGVSQITSSIRLRAAPSSLIQKQPDNLISEAAAANDIGKKCDQYANVAVAKHAMNIAHNCGLSGTRWNPDYHYHYDWCVSVSEKVSQEETKMRGRLLNDCPGVPHYQLMNPYH